MPKEILPIYTPEHKKARKELEEYIPSDLAVKFPQADFSKINKEARELFKEISLRIKKPDPQAELLFAKIMEYNKKMYSQEKISPKEKEFLKDLEKISEERKKELVRSLQILHLYQKGMENEDEYIRQATASALDSLYQINPDLASSLYQKGIEDENSYVREATASTLSSLCQINPDLYLSLYQKGIEDENSYVRKATASTLGSLCQINPDLYLSLYQKGIEDKDEYVREATASTLGSLCQINPDLASSLYQKGIEDENSYVRKATASTLGSLCQVNPDLYLSLYQKGMEDEDEYVRQATASTLEELCKTVDFPEEYFKLEKALKAKAPKDPQRFNFLLNYSFFILKQEKNFKEEIKKADLAYLSLFQLSQEMNQRQELEHKKVKNINDWWDKNSYNIANLLSIDTDLSKDLLSNLIYQGLPKTEAALNIYSRALNKEEIKDTINKIIKKTKKQLNGPSLGIFLETASSYALIEAEEEFKMILDKYMG